MTPYSTFVSLANRPHPKLVILRGCPDVDIDVSLAWHRAKVIVQIGAAQNTKGLVPQHALLSKVIVPAHCAVDALSVFAACAYRGWLGITLHRFTAELVLRVCRLIAASNYFKILGFGKR